MVELFRGVHYISSYISNMTLFNNPFHYFIQVRDVRNFFSQSSPQPLFGFVTQQPIPCIVRRRLRRVVKESLICGVNFCFFNGFFLNFLISGLGFASD